MKLKKISSNVFEVKGWGAGAGETIEEIYECPCGKGTVTYEKDDIPGFRDKSIFSDCTDCTAKYTFSRGNATLKI